MLGLGLSKCHWSCNHSIPLPTGGSRGRLGGWRRKGAGSFLSTSYSVSCAPGALLVWLFLPIVNIESMLQLLWHLEILFPHQSHQPHIHFVNAFIMHLFIFQTWTDLFFLKGIDFDKKNHGAERYGIEKYKCSCFANPI